MRRMALAAAVVAIAACSKTDKSATTDTTAAGGAVAPATDSVKRAMISGSSRASDSIHMMTSGSPGAMTTPAPDNKTGGAMGGDSAGMGGRHGDSTSGMKKTTPPS